MVNSTKVSLDMEILDYGPKFSIEGHELTPQQVIALASSMTYKFTSIREEALSIINNNKDFFEESKGKLMESSRRGHASLSTSVAMWIAFKGASNFVDSENIDYIPSESSSKFVDSLFTGAIHSSSLMPSSRRVRIEPEIIVFPISIFDSDNKIKELYYNTSFNNIQFYKELVGKGINKEQASKITQYGIVGGGFIFLPLETIIGYKKEFEIEGRWVPKEGHDFVGKIEENLKEIGMDLLYHTRDNAPRNPLHYPNIFTDPKKDSIINEFENKYGIFEKPFVIRRFNNIGNKFNEDLNKLWNLTEEILSNPENIENRWRELLLARHDFVKRYDGVLGYTSFTNTSWRVWGEVKRHRTLEQQVESIYRAAERALKVFNGNEDKIKRGDLNNILNELSSVYETPDSIIKDGGLRNKWFNLLLDSFYAYDKLRNNGVPESDAIAIIPRGLKLRILKNFSLYNLMDGYLPLRSCGTAEYEMKRTSEMEAETIRNDIFNNLGVNFGNAELMIPSKCGVVGFCLEDWKSYCNCQNVQKYIPFRYSKEFHDKIHAKHKGDIEKLLK